MKKVQKLIRFILAHPVSGKRPVTAMWKMVAWQLSQIKPTLKIIPFIEPVKFYAKKGWTGVTGNIYTGLHDFEEMGFILHFLRPGDVFADIGANNGTYTLLAGGVAGSFVMAFEPDPVVFKQLENNVQLNKLGHLVSIYNSAVGEEKGEIRFSVGLDTVNHVVNDDAEGDSINVKVDTLDSFCISAGKSINVVKIDVEGFESTVLKGMSNCLQDPACHAIIIELNGSGNRYGFNDKDIDSLLRHHQFTPISYDPFSRTITALERFKDTNTIYIKSPQLIASRLKNANKFTVFNQQI